MNTNNMVSRKQFIGQLALASGLLMMPGLLVSASPKPVKIKMKLGFVTYLWGKDWDIPTLITNLSKANISGVELRVDHAHGVGLQLSPKERKEVKKKFRSGGIEIVGMGTNQQYDYPDQAQLRESMRISKEFIKLSKDIGGSGIKVKPNQFHNGVPKSRTVDQIGRALNELARYGADFGQQIRLEVHGNETQEIDVIKDIMDVADHPNATVCWNCNPEDLKGKGLAGNFNLLKDRFGDICHVRELNDLTYPYQDLISLFLGMNFKGWILLECRTNPADKVQALVEQRKIFERMAGIVKS